MDYWKSEWFYHKKVIDEYFVGKKSKRLLTFNIGEDSPQKIVDFLTELDFGDMNFPWRNKG